MPSTDLFMIKKTSTQSLNMTARTPQVQMIQTMTKPKKKGNLFENFLHPDKIKLSTPLPFPVQNYKWKSVPDLLDFINAESFDQVNDIIFNAPVHAMTNDDLGQMIGIDDYGYLYTERPIPQ